MHQLDELIRTIPERREAQHNPSGLLFWSCEAYVIRVLELLQLRLPCHHSQLYDYIRERMAEFPKRGPHHPLPLIAL